MKITLFATLLAILTSCVTAPKLLPVSERTLSYEVKSKGDKKTNFSKMNLWVAKSFADSNQTVKLRDETLGKIIAKGNIPCDILKLGSGYADGQRIDFSLELTASQDVIQMKFTELIGRSISYAWDDAARPSSKDELRNVETSCVMPSVESMKDSVR
jgi:hypothetical protein